MKIIIESKPPQCPRCDDSGWYRTRCGINRCPCHGTSGMKWAQLARGLEALRRTERAEGQAIFKMIEASVWGQ